MKHTARKLWSVLLSLAMVLSLVPIVSLTASATDGEPVTYTVAWLNYDGEFIRTDTGVE